MEDQSIDLIEQIQRCRRLAKSVADDQMRDALEDLAARYEAQLKHEPKQGFMLRDRAEP